MKLPKEVTEVTFINIERYSSFPPLGFQAFEEGNNGAGDYYGLYWEFGKEDLEPIVCEMRHEEWSLEPVFPNLKDFIENFNPQTNDFEDTPWFYGENFFYAYYNQARAKSRKNPQKAVELLIESTNLFTEFSSSWYLLSKLLTDKDKQELKEKAAIKSFVSNWLFEMPDQKLVDNIKSINFQTDCKVDPLAKRINDLEFKSGFDGFNINYSVYKEIMTEYKKLNDIRSFILLYQNYGFLMEDADDHIINEFSFEFKEWDNDIRSIITEYYPKRKISS
jgi:hypothetical protein